MSTQDTENPHKRTILLVILITSFFSSFMAFAINIALPKIGAEFSMNAVTLSWVAMSFLLASAIFLIPIGKYADIVGRKKIFILGNIVFLLATFACTITASSVVLIVFRFIQGIGSAMIFSTSMAIIVSVFPPKDRGKMIGMNVSAVYLGLTLAPALGGLLTQTLGWRSIFYINIIANILPISIFATVVRAEWKDAAKEHFDFKGSILYMIAIFTMMVGFSKLPETFAIALLLVGIAFLIAFIMFEKNIQYPILPIKLFLENKIFLMSNLTALINYAATFAITFILSLYLQYVKGMSPRDAGMILITQPAMMVLIASFAGKLSDKYEPRILSTIGMSIIVVGLAMLIFLGQSTTIGYIISCLIMVGIGFGFFSSPNTNAIMGSVAKNQLGLASAMTGTMRILGQMISMAIATLVIHVMIGQQTISTENIGMFIASTKIIFSVFTVLCVVGIFASLTRGERVTS